MKLIDKSALVAEIERRIKKFREQKDYDSIVKTNTYKGLLSFLNTLEVKEVDLEKEWKEFLKDGDVGFKEIANHFFELGLKAQKGK